MRSGPTPAPPRDWLSPPPASALGTGRRCPIPHPTRMSRPSGGSHGSRGTCVPLTRIRRRWAQRRRAWFRIRCRRPRRPLPSRWSWWLASSAPVSTRPGLGPRSVPAAVSYGLTGRVSAAPSVVGTDHPAQGDLELGVGELESVRPERRRHHPLPGKQHLCGHLAAERRPQRDRWNPQHRRTVERPPESGRELGVGDRLGRGEVDRPTQRLVFDAADDGRDLVVEADPAPVLGAAPEAFTETQTEDRKLTAEGPASPRQHDAAARHHGPDAGFGGWSDRLFPCTAEIGEGPRARRRPLGEDLGPAVAVVADGGGVYEHSRWWVAHRQYLKDQSRRAETAGSD